MHLDRVTRHRGRGARGHRKKRSDVGHIDGPMLTGDAIELFEDLGGTKHGRLFALDLDRVVAGRYANPEG
jgi:hypothetical protein